METLTIKLKQDVPLEQHTWIDLERVGALKPKRVDPFKPRLEEAPEEIRQAVAEAEQRLKDAQQLRDRDFKRFIDAMKEKNKLEKKSQKRTSQDTIRLAELVSVIPALEQSYKRPKEEEERLRFQFAKADSQMRMWLWEEKQRRKADAQPEHAL